MRERNASLEELGQLLQDMRNIRPKEKREEASLTVWIPKEYKERYRNIPPSERREFYRRLQVIIARALDIAYPVAS